MGRFTQETEQCVKAFYLSQLGAWVTGVIAEKRMLWCSLLRADTDSSSPPPGHGWAFVRGPQLSLVQGGSVLGRHKPEGRDEW